MKYGSVLPLFTLLMCSIPQANAAVPVKAASVVRADDGVIMALRLPMENRIVALKRRPGSFEELKALSFDSKQALRTRWSALTALARLDFQKAKPALVQALSSKEWFMRNAALVTLVSGDKLMAYDYSTKLLKDPALVVRTAAVENLRQLRDRRSRETLLQALNAPENFKGKQSLWVRHHIARALSEMAIPGEEGFLVGLLREEDKRLHPWAMRGLERLTGRQMGSQDPLKHRDQWISWWQTSRNS